MTSLNNSKFDFYVAKGVKGVKGVGEGGSWGMCPPLSKVGGHKWVLAPPHFGQTKCSNFAGFFFHIL